MQQAKRLAVISGLFWLLATPIPAQNTKSSQSEILSGTWLLTAELDPNPVLPETIVLLGDFTREGGFSSSSDLPGIPVAGPFLTLGEGHGSWQRVGHGQFRLETWRLAKSILDGNLFGLAKGQADVVVDGKTGLLEGEITLQLLFPDLTPAAPPEVGVLTGVRLGPEPATP